MPIEKDPDASQPRARPQRVSDATQTPQLSATVSRRHFVIGAGGIAASSLLGAASLLVNSDDEKAKIEWAEHFQTHYRLMTDVEKAEAIERLERRYSKQYGKDVVVSDSPAQEGYFSVTPSIFKSALVVDAV